MSWGFDEMPNESSYDSYFTTPAGHAGITFIAASGDNGTVEYPSASPECPFRRRDHAQPEQLGHLRLRDRLDRQRRRL